MIEEVEAPVSREHKLYWWKEAAIVAVFYAVYSAARNQFGSALVDVGQEPVHAFNNAMRVIRWERALGLFHEETIQDWFLPYKGFIQFWNTFYGTAHFIVTIGVFIWLFRRDRAEFPRWRNTLALTTALAIVGFSLFPLMPPRLLNNDSEYGGQRIAIEEGYENFGFVDTLEEYGGPWSFDSGTMQEVSNQYAAMPSLHIAWASWCALVVFSLTRNRWARALAAIYPLATLFTIVVTGNHFWLDGVGGLVALGAGYAIGAQLHLWNQRRLTHRHERELARRSQDATWNAGQREPAVVGGEPDDLPSGSLIERGARTDPSPVGPPLVGRDGADGALRGDP